jgi:UDPglucose 6-dehydrogenase
MENGEKVITITQIGGGFVGNAVWKGFTHYGYDVTIVEINMPLVESLKANGVDACFMNEGCATNRKFYFVSVPTPMIDEDIDLRFLRSAVASLGVVIKNSTNWPIIVIRSTVPPGTTENDLVPILEKYSGKKVGEDFGISMNPEFLREKTAEHDFLHPWAIVVGSNDHRVAKAMEELYAPFNVKVKHLLIKEAELEKYFSNISNAISISALGELREIAKAVGCDPERIFKVLIETAETFWNPKYGTLDLGPFGGSCLPKDTRAFKTWAKKELGLTMPILDAVIQANERIKEKEYLGI